MFPTSPARCGPARCGAVRQDALTNRRRQEFAVSRWPLEFRLRNLGLVLPTSF